MKTLLRSACILALAVAITGLCSCGSSAKVEMTETTGQELQDLQDAYDKGLLTEDEYQKQRAAILKRT